MGLGFGQDMDSCYYWGNGLGLCWGDGYIAQVSVCKGWGGGKGRGINNVDDVILGDGVGYGISEVEWGFGYGIGNVIGGMLRGGLLCEVVESSWRKI